MTNTTKVQKQDAKKVAGRINIKLLILSWNPKEFTTKDFTELSKQLKKLESISVKETGGYAGMIYDTLQKLRNRKELVDERGNPLSQRKDIDVALKRFSRSRKVSKEVPFEEKRTPFTEEATEKPFFGERGGPSMEETTSPVPQQDMLSLIPTSKAKERPGIKFRIEEVEGKDVFTHLFVSSCETSLNVNEFGNMWIAARDGRGTALKNKIDSMTDKDVKRLVGTDKNVEKFKEHIKKDEYEEAWGLVQKEKGYEDSRLIDLGGYVKEFKKFIIDVPINMFTVGTEKETPISKHVAVSVGALAQLIRIKRYTKTIRTNPDGSETLILETMEDVKKAKGRVSKSKTRNDVSGEAKVGFSAKLDEGVKIKFHFGAVREAVRATTKMKYGEDLLGFVEVEYKDEKGINIKKVPVYTGAKVRVKSNKDLEATGNLAVAVFSLGEDFPVMLLTDLTYARQHDLKHNTLYVMPGIQVGRVRTNVVFDPLKEGRPMGGMASVRLGTESTIGLGLLRPLNPMTGNRNTLFTIGIHGRF